MDELTQKKEKNSFVYDPLERNRETTSHGHKPALFKFLEEFDNVISKEKGCNIYEPQKKNGMQRDYSDLLEGSTRNSAEFCRNDNETNGNPSWRRRIQGGEKISIR
ncbi:uncharacterized protein J3R85_001777 [Psidium guajava]|nr:uncharacterized protein J3R85_001777 [Psidium guajava]